MKAADLGVATGEEENTESQQEAGGGDDKSSDAGQHSDKGHGTGDDSTKTHDDNSGEDTGSDQGDGTGNDQGEGGELDEKDKRINGLMSEWQKEEHAHGETKSELQRYRETFGDLPGEGGKHITKEGNKQKSGQGSDDPSVPDALKPGWAPKDMAELQEGMKQVAAYAAQMGAQQVMSKQDSEKKAREEAEKQTNEFISQVKTADPEFDEKAFFAYANKYSFPLRSVSDLRGVYRAYHDHTKAIASAQKQGAGNRDKRSGDGVNKPGSGAGKGSGVPFSKIQGAGSATDLVHDALNDK